jgi:hypothetical protein
MKLKIVLFGILGLLVLYGFTAKVSESNLSCGYCHDQEHVRWEASTHKTINCRACHIDPGLSGAFQAQMQGIQNLFVAVTRGTDIDPHVEPIPISTENCMGCHGAILHVNELGYEDLPDNSLKGQSLKIGHRVHVEKYALNCVECHRGIVHRDPEAIGKYTANWPFMHTDCGPCHDGKYRERFQVEVTSVEDRGKCTVCHPTYEPQEGYEPGYAEEPVEEP